MHLEVVPYFFFLFLLSPTLQTIPATCLPAGLWFLTPTVEVYHEEIRNLHSSIKDFCFGENQQKNPYMHMPTYYVCMFGNAAGREHIYYMHT
jgi:hypothetical protein